MINKIKLKSVLSPGDAVVMTAAIRSLHTVYPDEYITAVETTAMEIWENNPFITPADDTFKECDLNYNLIHKSNSRAVSFLEAYVDGLSKVIERPLYLTTNRPDLYITNEERSWMDQIQQYFSHGRKIPFWLINCGVKKDFTAKQWPVEYYQEVIDKTAGRIQWVQIGAKEHEHHPMRGVIDLVGKTSTRELIRLAFHCEGGLGPSTFLQHLCAAFEKHYLCILGGREPVPWVTYPKQTTFHTIGQIDCCRKGACWISRVIPLHDGDEKDNKLCDVPILGMIKPVGKCMAMIRPEEILSVLSRTL